MLVGSVGFAGGAQLIDLLRPRLERLVFRLDGQGEARIGLRVFVPTINDRVLRQRHQLLQRLPHHLGVAFDDPAAAEGKQRVSGKSHPGGGAPVGDMAGGMAGCVDDAHLEAAKVETVALPDGLIDTGYLSLFRARPDDLAARCRLERQVSSGMISVMMRRQNLR